MSQRNLAIAFGLLMLGGFYPPSADCQQPKPALVQPAPLHVIWDGNLDYVFGFDRSTSNITYCLMGNGYILAPRSANFKHLVFVWLSKHPKAKVVPIAKFGPLMVDQPHSEQVYAWVVDNKDNLNEYLIRHGGCESGTMLVPQDLGYSRILIPEQEYIRVLKSMAKAEDEAQKEKLGIWKHGTNID